MQATPSRTCEITAIMRALHQAVDHEPKILVDAIAPQLIESADRLDDRLLPTLRHSFAKRWRAGFVLRSRYAEDCLADAVGQGAGQYLILGAGLDTFAYRQPAWANSLRIYELDHPATQSWKRNRLAASNIDVPPNLTFVPLDFEDISLADALHAVNFSYTSKTFCSWLGVTPYLTATAIHATLEFMLSFPPTSEIVFNFVLPADAVSGIEAEAMMLTAQKCAEAGEPWLTSFLPDNLTGVLTAIGFRDVIHLTPDEANRRYFRHRRDGLEARLGERLVRAIV